MDTSPKRMVNRHIKRCTISLITRKCKSKPQCNITSHWSKWLSSKSVQRGNAGEDVERRNPLYTVEGNVIGAATMKKSMEFP